MIRRTDLWPLIHAERARLADDLAGLTESRWDTPSLCDGLSVREVLAHLTSGASLTGLRWLAGVIRCRFDFDRQVAMRLAEELGDSAAETLARFRRVVPSTTSPPLPRIAMLGEVIVHGEDIRRPLGIAGHQPVGAVTRVAEYYSRSNQMVAAKDHVAGLRLAAADGPFTAGDGLLVEGPTVALVMAMTGRHAFLDDLSGDGVEVLRERVIAGRR
ncbi:maleylpyruvate isomerase family mycothiol-dependent enzyme [Jiangella endophytica]|uniref:maleylpyruvate isomerase family mycothiol-dependent enzyme n=1 Tax=Jiangella endophytica TaxID=1623398 RepID=UPI000E3547F5|nr:maleylpyruvate isomerase family mycothiol-dependent enzyme [Jiangella endophytica]